LSAIWGGGGVGGGGEWCWRGGQSKQHHGFEQAQVEESRRSYGARKRMSVWVRVHSTAAYFFIFLLDQKLDATLNYVFRIFAIFSLV
jgi:hypothetical protein